MASTQEFTMPRLHLELVTMILSELEDLSLVTHDEWLTPVPNRSDLDKDAKSFLKMLKEMLTVSRSWRAASVPFVFGHGTIKIRNVERARAFYRSPWYVHENVRTMQFQGDDFAEGFEVPYLPKLKALTICLPGIKGWRVDPPELRVSGLASLGVYKKVEANEEEKEAFLASMRKWVDLDGIQKLDGRAQYGGRLKARFRDRDPIVLVSHP